LLDEVGVQVYTDTTVERVLVEAGRAVGVEAGGGRFRARRAILASVTPTTLYGSLLPTHAVTPAVRGQAAAYRYGRAAMQVHVALSGPPRWRNPRLRDVPLIHISDGSASTAIACAEAEAGLLPRRPTVVVGQQFVLDPSRNPPAAGSLWMQLQEVPFQPRGDAMGQICTATGWTDELAKAYAQRVIDRVGAHARGLATQVRAVTVISPHDLHSYNPNAIAGDPYGGRSELEQSFFWRPLPGAARHRTHVKRLWHIGASTHPGPGLGAGSGHLVATALTAHQRGTRPWPGMSST
jgi:phytoene dehydrogenase-like protein